jgi:thiol-disulfide isomerase/thioredoxin
MFLPGVQTGEKHFKLDTMINLKKYFLILLFFLASVQVKAQIKQGYAAPEIALPAANGDTIRLSSLKGKVVLLDFWASWCGPCRASNKQLVKLYPKYKTKGFEIFSVSIDDDKDKWINAVKKDKINWLQVNEGGGWDAKTAVKWSIYAIPTSYLIDQEGKLIAMDLEGKELEKTLKDMLGK